MALQPLWALAAIFGFLIYLRAVGLLGRVISLSQGITSYTNQNYRQTLVEEINNSIQFNSIQFIYLQT
jgi:hypothetical protein